jgi:uncharacterized protein YlxW (UPF0749 family)
MPAEDDQRTREAAVAARLPPQATMGLLDYLSTHTLDEDYAFVSERKAARREPPSRRRIGVVGALVLASFAALVATAAVQTSRSAAADEQQRQELVEEVGQARDQLDAERAQLERLGAENDVLEARQLRGDSSARGLVQTIEDLRVLTGAVAVRGPGVRVEADNAPGATSASNQVLDSDLQKLVNGLWAAGAEAISINGQRLTNLSTIRLAGGAITVNSRSLRRPYVVSAIGDPDTLPARFAESSSGQAWLDLEREVGLQLSITTADTLRLPAAEVSLRYANQEPEETP